MRIGLLGAMAAAACQPIVTFEAPTLDPNYQSGLLITRAPGGSAMISELVPQTGRAPTIRPGSFADGTELSLVYFRASRESLFLDLLDTPDDRPTRPLPAFDAAFRRTLPDEGWRPLDAADLAELRLPAPTEAGCAERDGCYLDAEAAAALDCKVPCIVDIAPIAARRPSPPDMGTCLPHWTRRVDPPKEGLVLSVCEPPPTLVCTGATVQWVGSSSCAVVGSACPADWPTNLPTGRPLLHVRPGAAPGGDGGPNSPFATLADAALAGVGLDPVLVLAPGVHHVDLPLQLRDHYWVRGACASGTLIEGPANAATLFGDGIDIEIRDVAVRPGRGGHGLYLGPGAALRLVDATITGPTALGVWVEAGATIDLDRVVVRTATAVGIQIFGEGRLHQVVVEDSSVIGARVEGGHAEMDHLAVRRVAPGTHDIAGCVVAAYDAWLTLEDSSLESCTTQGVQFFESKGAVRRTTIRDIEPHASIESFALGVQSIGSGISVEQVRIVGARSYGLGAQHSTIGGSDLVIEDSISDPGDVQIGKGISTATSRVELTRVWVVRSDSAGIHLSFAEHDETVVTSTLSDLIIDETLGRSPETGEGLAVAAFNRATVDRALVIDSGRRSLALFNDAKVRVSDLTVVRGGIGARLDDDTRLTLHRASIQGALAGLCMTKTSSATIDNLVILDADAHAPKNDDACALVPSPGGGVILTDMSQLRVRQARITRSGNAALTFARSGTIRLEDALVDHNRVGFSARPAQLRGSLIRTRFDANPILFDPQP